MASSGTYRQWARESRSKAKAYRKQKETLEQILEDVQKDFDNNASDVNKALGKCREDLIGDGVRHLSSFDSSQSDLISGMWEKADYQDGDMVALRDALSAEINALERKVQDCEDDAANYDRQAQAAAAREKEERERAREEFLKNLLGI